MVSILKYIDCCIIFHNLLIKLDGDDEMENIWIDDGDISDIDNCDRAPTATDMIYRTVPQ